LPYVFDFFLCLFPRLELRQFLADGIFSVRLFEALFSRASPLIYIFFSHLIFHFHSPKGEVKPNSHDPDQDHEQKYIGDDLSVGEAAGRGDSRGRVRGVESDTDRTTRGVFARCGGV
jgi:hypothetical protein